MAAQQRLMKLGGPGALLIRVSLGWNPHAAYINLNKHTKRSNPSSKKATYLPGVNNNTGNFSLLVSSILIWRPHGNQSGLQNARFSA